MAEVRGWWAEVSPTIVAPKMGATATLPAPRVSNVGVAPPPFTATAALRAPSLGVDINLFPPKMQAAAAVAAPGVGIGVFITLGVPSLSATAGLAAPAVVSNASVVAPVMTSGGNFNQPGIGAGLTAAQMQATAALRAPAVGISTAAHYTDDFNRADNTSLGASWTTPAGFDQFRILSNTAASPSDGALPLAEYVSPLATNDHKVSVTIGASVPTAVFLTIRGNGTEYVYALCRSDPAILSGVGTITGDSSPYVGDGTTIGRADTALSFTSGDVISFQAVGNVYTLKKNGTTAMSWTDSGGAYSAYVNSSHRKVAMLLIANADDNGVDDFAADDI